MSELSKSKLLQNRQDFLLAFLLLTLISIFTLSSYYQDYLKIKSFHWFETDMTVLKQITKVKKKQTYYQLELKSDKLHLYTRSQHRIKNLVGRNVSLVILTHKITFLHYLTSFFAPSKLLSVSRTKNQRFSYIDTVHQSHKEAIIANLYGALYWVEPIQKPLRENSQP